jgi:hypothetical protein
VYPSAAGRDARLLVPPESLTAQDPIDAPVAHAFADEEERPMSTMFRTIVGGRDRQDGGSAGRPRGIEVLLKKAKVDARFREQLLEDPAAAAAAIGLVLQDSEKRMLASSAESTLRLMIDRTFVPRHHVGTYMSRNVTAMLALVIASTVTVTAAGSGVDDAAKGITGEESIAHARDMVQREITIIRDALEAYRRDHGSYPSTETWITTGNPLQGYVGNSDLHDPWGRKLHYQAIVKDGKIVNYCMESLGADFMGPQDDITSADPLHRFPVEKPLFLREPFWTPDSHLVLRAEHEDGNQAVEWYLDGKMAGRTVGTHRLILETLAGGEHVLLVADGSGHFATVVFRAPNP